MVRDYWLYQERKVYEPWAAHLHVIAMTSIDIRFYAEYLPATCENVLDVSCDRSSLLEAFKVFSERHNVGFTLDEVQQINSLWLRIANDLGLVI